MQLSVHKSATRLQAAVLARHLGAVAAGEGVLSDLEGTARNGGE
jgi:hypothetical protein